MKNNPLISVINPTYNPAGTIEKCLKSMENTNTKNIVSIISPFTPEEINNHQFGGTTLIWMQYQYFIKKGFKTNIVYLSELNSVTSYIIRLVSKISQLNHKKSEITSFSASRRWFINLSFWIFMEFFSRFDFLFKREISKALNASESKIILCNYPIYYNTLHQLCKKKGIKCILFEHNAEYFFYMKMLHGTTLSKHLIGVLKNIEFSAIKKSEMTFVLTSEDQKILLRDLNKKYTKRISVWVPFDYVNEIYSKSKLNQIKKNASLEDKKFYKNLKNRQIIGFIGAYFEPNIIAVEDILKIAKNIKDKNVVFLIIGHVCDAFKNRKDIPENVIMNGYVKNLDFYLSICDCFINPKTVSDTGIEIKMFDYLKFNKTIMSTEIGANGFENFNNVVLIKNIDHFCSIIR